MSDPGQPGTWQFLGLWDGEVLNPGATLDRLPDSDHDAAMLICAERPGELHYAVGTGTWHIWDGRCHAPDTSGYSGRLISDYAQRARIVLERAASEIRMDVRGSMEPDASEAQIREAIADRMKPWDRQIKYHAGLLRTAGHSALHKMLQVMCGCDDASLAERHPGWLNTASGTVDLATGLVRPHDPRDLITYCLDVPYLGGRPWERCPRFLALAARMCGGDLDVMWCLIELLGYALLGDNREQKIIYLSGDTGSGKSKLLHIVRTVLGALGHESQADLITVVRHGRNARTENSIRGRRLLTITETSAFMLTEEAQLKRLTGESVISVNQHYARTELKTPVTWTIFVATNQMPTLTNFDDAMRRRIIVIPTGAGLREHEMNPRVAEQILAAESEGIASLLVQACGQYLRRGSLMIPHVVAMATDRYAQEQNTVANFLAECADLIMPNGSGPAVVAMSAAWSAYERWARGGSKLGRNEFYEHMSRQPGVSRNDAMRRFEGLRLKDLTLMPWSP